MGDPLPPHTATRKSYIHLILYPNKSGTPLRENSIEAHGSLSVMIYPFLIRNVSVRTLVLTALQLRAVRNVFSDSILYLS